MILWVIGVFGYEDLGYLGYLGMRIFGVFGYEDLGYLGMRIWGIWV